MSENIIIKDGIEKPWELPGTDYEKPENIILANLAMGQLAFLGSKFGKYLNTQAMVTAELAEAVEKVKTRSAEASSLLQNWNTDTPKLDLSMPASGWPPTSQEVNLTDGSLSDVDKLFAANNLLSQYNIANQSVPPLNSTDLQDGRFPCTYTLGPRTDGKTATGFSFASTFIIDIGNPGDPPPEFIPDFQIYFKVDNNIGQIDYTRPFVKWDGVEYQPQNLRMMWVPRSQADIDYFNNQLACVNKTADLAIFSDATQLVPTPTEASTASSGSADINQQPPVTMEIPLNKIQNSFLEFKLETGSYYYYQKTASEIPVYKAGDESKYAGSVVQMEDKSYRYVVEVTDKNGLKTYSLIKTDPPKIGVKSFTGLEKSDIISKYADKNVRITQRSSEQANYVTALVQRYNYFFEAATNILKAFTNLWSSLSSNV